MISHSNSTLSVQPSTPLSCSSDITLSMAIREGSSTELLESTAERGVVELQEDNQKENNQLEKDTGRIPGEN